MRTVLQRVIEASVAVSGVTVASIGTGLVVFVGIEEADLQDDVEWLAGKIVRLRVFPDEQGVMNRSVREADGDILVVSQFTLHASTRKGNRPSYVRSARPEIAVPLYRSFVESLQRMLEKRVPTGEFGAMMEVSLVNDGPVTIIIDSRIRE